MNDDYGGSEALEKFHGEDLHTAYFFAGGRARSPCVKGSAYFAFLSTRFCWIGVAILGTGLTCEKR